jgi:nicotinamidase-related amidase
VSGDRLQRERAALVIVDVQQAFAKAVPGYERVVRAAATLARGAEALGVPVVVTEQYPKGLGRTDPAVAEALPDGVEPLEKIEFSAASAPGFDLGGRDQVVLCGIEAHVCVAQTALELLDRGLAVHVAADAVASRSVENEAIGLRRTERAGAVPTSVETALFELLGRAGTDEFKAVQRLILDYAPNPTQAGASA